MAGDADDNKKSSAETTSTDQLWIRRRITMAAELALVKYALEEAARDDVRRKERFLEEGRMN